MMISQGISSGNFSFSLAPDDAELYLAGWNPIKSKGDFTWLDLNLDEDQEPGLFEVTMDEVALVGQERKVLAGQQTAYIDIGESLGVGRSGTNCGLVMFSEDNVVWPRHTGTTLMIGGIDVVDQIYQGIPGARNVTDGQRTGESRFSLRRSRRAKSS